jgi:hypothetical protein
MRENQMSEADFPKNDSATIAPLKPYAVTIPVAKPLLANKCRSEIYEAIARGELDAIKDGPKTLIVVASIERYMRSRPPARIGDTSGRYAEMGKLSASKRKRRQASLQPFTPRGKRAATVDAR